MRIERLEDDRAVASRLQAAGWKPVLRMVVLPSDDADADRPHWRSPADNSVLPEAEAIKRLDNEKNR